MTPPALGVHTPKPRVCSLCRSAEPKAGCPQCELTQPSLFWLPQPPLTAEDIAASDAELEAALTETLDRARRAELLRYWASLDRPIRVGLVGCSKTKLPHPHAARHFYTSPLFQAALTYAERATDDVYVLSALHELIAPDRRLEPYDRRLDEMTKKERLAWGERVVDKIAARLPRIRVQLVVLAGNAYAIPVRVHALGRGWTVENPLAGLAVGERVRWLKREAEALVPCPQKRKYRRRSP